MRLRERKRQFLALLTVLAVAIAAWEAAARATPPRAAREPPPPKESVRRAHHGRVRPDRVGVGLALGQHRVDEGGLLQGERLRADLQRR